MKDFGEIIIWEVVSDTQNELSLLRAIDQTVKAGDCAGTGSTTLYADSDGDENPYRSIQACEAPENYVTNK